MGRNAQPIQIIKAKRKSHHLTKEEIKHRQESEIKFEGKELKCPSYIKNDIVAFTKWRELASLYKDIDFVSTADSGTLARYCKTYSEYLRLIRERDRLTAFELHWDEKEIDLDDALEDGINRLLRLDPFLKLESAINKKHELLIKLDDRLYLNPVSRTKNIPKKPQKGEKDPNADLFD